MGFEAFQPSGRITTNDYKERLFRSLPIFNSVLLKIIQDRYFTPRTAREQMLFNRKRDMDYLDRLQIQKYRARERNKRKNEMRERRERRGR